MGIGCDCGGNQVRMGWEYCEIGRAGENAHGVGTTVNALLDA